MQKILTFLMVLPALSTVAFGGEKLAFSLACKTPGTDLPQVTFAGSGFEKGHIFKSWDFGGTIFVALPSASEPIRVAVQSPGLISNNIGIQLRTAPAETNTPHLSAEMSFWLPDGLGAMPAVVESFKTDEMGKSFATKILIKDLTAPADQPPVYADSNAKLECAWTRVRGVKPSFWESLLEGVGQLGVEVLFPDTFGH